MKKFIEEYYYSSSNDVFNKKNSAKKYSSIAGQLNEMEDDILMKLADEDKELFKQYIDKYSEFLSLAEKENYIRGFRKGALCMLDIMM